VRIFLVCFVIGEDGTRKFGMSCFPQWCSDSYDTIVGIYLTFKCVMNQY
jgi:hypothetical protein